MRHPLLRLIALLSCIAAPLSGAAQTKPAEEINHLLDFVARSPCVFMRDGRSYPPAEARVHLERKYAYLRDRIKTAEDFITLAASRSSVSGESYRVRCAPGGELETSDWLTAELQRLRHSPR